MGDYCIFVSETTCKMELYEYARPEVMSGKKILYLHGFASSGATGTARTLRVLLPQTEVLSPDIPEDPHVAVDYLKDLCSREKPDLVIGTSMGGMYASLLRGYDRILNNPAFQLADTLLKNYGLGRHEYFNPRQDGATSILMTKGLLEAFRDVSSHCFDGIPEIDPRYPTPGNWTDEQNRVYGLFGIHDTLVHTYDLFASRFPNAIRFDGEHHVDDKALLHSVLPIIQRIDDRQEGRSRKVIFIQWENTLADLRNNLPRGMAPEDFTPENSAVKAFRELSRRYDVYVVACPSYNHPSLWPDPVRWAEKWLGVEAWGHVIQTEWPQLLLGDYFIVRNPEHYRLEDFMGTVLQLGGDTFRTWEDILAFYATLGGQ